MTNTCIVCGKRFKAKTWNAQVCSDACREQRQYEIWLKHSRKELESQIVSTEQVKDKKEHRRKTGNSHVEVRAGDPKWIKDYAQGDRLTQIAMLARALTDSGLRLINYGELSTMWNTTNYKIWESMVLALKRKENQDAAVNTEEKNELKSKDKP